MIQQFHLSVFIQRKWKHLKRCLHPYVHCRIICSNQEMETSKCLLMDEWIKMCCISQLYKYEYYSAIKKEGNPAICDYMDELWRHYTKWSKPDRKTSVAAAKLRQSCLTLCNPINGSPPGSAGPGILQARTLEWVAISFSSPRKWKVKVKSLSCVQLFATSKP